MISCSECPYYRNDHDFDDDALDLTSCHYRWNDGQAPCEVENMIDVAGQSDG